jgi:hypothetical protein
LADARDLKSRGNLFPYRFDPGLRHQYNDAEWSSLVARRAHNPEVVGSNPASATKYEKVQRQGAALFSYLDFEKGQDLNPWVQVFINTSHLHAMMNVKVTRKSKNEQLHVERKEKVTRKSKNGQLHVEREEKKTRSSKNSVLRVDIHRKKEICKGEGSSFVPKALESDMQKQE